MLWWSLYQSLLTFDLGKHYHSSQNAAGKVSASFRAVLAERRKELDAILHQLRPDQQYVFGNYRDRANANLLPLTQSWDLVVGISLAILLQSFQARMIWRIQVSFPQTMPLK
jgi:hypothetical protein